MSTNAFVIKRTPPGLQLERHCHSATVVVHFAISSHCVSKLLKANKSGGVLLVESSVTETTVSVTDMMHLVSGKVTMCVSCVIFDEEL